MAEARRDVVKIGLDFRTIPVDLGDGIEWEFVPDPSPEQWSILMNALKTFERLFGGGADPAEAMSDTKTLNEALKGFTEAMAGMLSSEEQKEAWIEKNYGLGPQQAISEKLTELWTGFPTKEPKPSGAGSKTDG